MTRMQTLTRDLGVAVADWKQTRSETDRARVNVLRRKITTLHRQRVLSRGRREMLFDLNGHHGAA